MKKYLKAVILLLMGHTIVPLCRTKLKRTVTVLLYHDIDCVKFSSHVEYLRQHYNLISLRDYAGLLDGDTELPDNSLIITIDDGWRDNFKLLETIKSYSIPVTIFLCAGLVGTNRKIWNYSIDRSGQDKELNEKLKDSITAEKNKLLMEYNGHFPEKEYAERTLLSFSEVEEMSPYVDFQSHGIFHEVLPMCDEEVLQQEVSDSIGLLENIVGNDIYAFAFPYGRRNDRCIEKVQDVGYKVARTSNIPGLNSLKDPCFELKSVGVGDTASVDDLKRVELWAKLRFLYDSTFQKSVFRK